MTVHPGFGGQEFITENVEKIRLVRKKGGERLHIAVDGGINCNTGPLVCEAGANVLIAGTFLFKSSDMAGTLAELRSACAECR